MAGRTSDGMSTTDGSVDEERESWLYRSTVCANEEEEHDSDDGSDGGACTWSPLFTPTPFSVAAKAGGGVQVKSCFEAKVAKKTETSSSSCSRNARRKLPLLSGFSNGEALRPQLPRNISKQPQVTHCDTNLEKKGPRKVNSSWLQAADASSNDLLPSKDDVEANRRKWDRERMLQDATQSANKVDMTYVPEQKPGLRLKVLAVNPTFPSAAEAEANRRKWDLERQLQDSERSAVLVDESNAPEHKRRLKRKLPGLNSFIMKKNLHAPSAAEVEANRRKWDLERSLQEADVASVAAGHRNALQHKRQLTHKLQNLNPFVVKPVTPSAADVEANRRKWDRERQLQDAARNGTSVVASSDFERKCPLTHKLPTLNPGAYSVTGTVEASTKNWEQDESMRNGLKLNECLSGSIDRNQALEVFSDIGKATMRQERHGYEMGESLVYLLLFSSTAVLHCAIFNFNLELRQFLKLDVYPFGVMLLLSWTFVGLIHFVGGLVGDFVKNRVLLLRRIAILWGTAIVALHVAAFNFSPPVSSICMVFGLLLAGIAHGVICPNVIALRVESTLCNLETVSSPLSPEVDDASSSDDDSDAESEASYLSDISTTESDGQLQERDLVSHRFFSGCFAARLAGSSLVQGYYFLLVDADTYADLGSPMSVRSRGFHCMLFMSFTLLASLIFFSYQSWGYLPSSDFAGESTPCEMLQLKLVRLEQGVTTFDETAVKWNWANLMHLCNRALVGYALLAFVLMALVGVGFSLVVVLLASQTSLSVRLVAFMLIVIGWLLSLIASSRQLNPRKKKLLRECRRFGFRSRELYLVIFAGSFICVSGCASFLRAQLYTTLVVQVCQTRLLIPGTNNTLMDPELLGTAVGASSLLLLGLAQVFTKHSASSLAYPATPMKAITFAPTRPVIQKAGKRWLSRHLLPSIASCPPVTRMCFAMLLYLLSVFLSSVVELYRRKAQVSPSVLPRSCGVVHSEFSFLWTSPYVVLLGASDALFRVSLQEVCNDLAQGSFASMPGVRWAGTVQGAISLAEALGYSTALSFVAVLSQWLFRPEPTDMALLFLLLTTVVALTHALLNRIADRAQAYQRLYFPARCHSAQPAK